MPALHITMLDKAARHKTNHQISLSSQCQTSQTCLSLRYQNIYWL